MQKVHKIGYDLCIYGGYQVRERNLLWASESRDGQAAFYRKRKKQLQSSISNNQN